MTAALTQHGDEQVRAAVHDLGLVAETWHGVDHAEHLEHLDLAEIAGRQLGDREQAQANLTRVLVALLDRHAVADAAWNGGAVRPARTLAREIDGAAVELEGHVVT